MRVIVSFIFLVFLFHGVFAQEKLSFRLIDKSSKKPISFASIRAFDYDTLGSISDSEGRFQFYFPDGIDSIRFNISASSYLPLNIYLCKSKKLQVIELEERIFELDEVVVVSQKEFEINWHETTSNLKLYGSKTDNGIFVPMMMDLGSSGEYHGNAFKINKPIKLTEVSFHFYLEKGYPEKLFLRIFQTDDKLDLSANMSLDRLRELTRKTILVNKLKNGFNIVDVSKEEIILNGGYLVIAFTADLSEKDIRKLTIFQEKSGGKEILRFALNQDSYVIFPSFLPKYLIGFSYLEMGKGKNKRLINL
jgi:hypothetical protein